MFSILSVAYMRCWLVHCSTTLTALVLPMLGKIIVVFPFAHTYFFEYSKTFPTIALTISFLVIVLISPISSSTYLAHLCQPPNSARLGISFKSEAFSNIISSWRYFPLIISLRDRPLVTIQTPSGRSLVQWMDTGTYFPLILLKRVSDTSISGI